jgi:hypothetical protein
VRRTLYGPFGSSGFVGTIFFVREDFTAKYIWSRLNTQNDKHDFNTRMNLKSYMAANVGSSIGHTASLIMSIITTVGPLLCSLGRNFGHREYL